MLFYLFKSLFNYSLNNLELPSITAKINLYFFINIRIFKLKLNNVILITISSLNSLKFKKKKFFYKTFNFNVFFFNFSFYFLSIFSLFSLYFLI